MRGDRTRVSCEVTHRPAMTWHGTWPRATARAGLPGTRFHDLRHFYASALIAAGLSVKVVQARLGHKTAQETLDTYGHLWPDDEDRTRQAVSEALAVREKSARSAESPRNRGLLMGTDVR